MRLSALMFIALALACACMPMQAAAQQGFWYHNGSVMQVNNDGPHITISYLSPRPGMRQAGARPGDVVLQANIWGNGNRIEGYAYVFKLGCEPAEYPVRGWINAAQNHIEVSGMAPVFDAASCAVIGYQWIHNSRLVFTYR